LSPGINDPTTALYCIDRLGEVLGRLAGRNFPASFRLDQNGHLRIATEVFLMEDVTCRAFAAIARYGISDADVVSRLVETLAKLETSVLFAARVVIAEFREQVLTASLGSEIQGFDRKILSDFQDINK